MTEGEAAHRLGAYIDGEGYVTTPATGRRSGRRIAISNTEIDIIRAVEYALMKLDIGYAVYEKKARNGCVEWQVTISKRENLEKVLDLVPLASGRKWSRLVACLEDYQ